MSDSPNIALRLTEEERSEMRHAYEKEYIELSRRLDHVRGILSKLGAEPNTDGLSDSSLQEGATAPKTVVRRKRRKKRGPKSIWGAFILDRLKKMERPMTYSEILDDAMLIHNIPSEKIKNAKASILNSAFRLRTVHKKIETKGAEGRKEKFIVLKRWVNENGELNEPYNGRYQQLLQKQKEELEAKKPPVDPNAPPKRRGRPPGSKNKKKSTAAVVKATTSKRRGRPSGSKNKKK